VFRVIAHELTEKKGGEVDVILRQRSFRQSRRLPTKDLCTRFFPTQTNRGRPIFALCKGGRRHCQSNFRRSETTLPSPP